MSEGRQSASHGARRKKKSDEQSRKNTHAQAGGGAYQDGGPNRGKHGKKSGTTGRQDFRKNVRTMLKYLFLFEYLINLLIKIN